MTHGPAVIVDQGILNGQPIRAISYLEPEQEWDSGYALFSRAADETDASSGALVCIDCLLDQHPEAGEGMDLARKHGLAIRDNNWMAGADHGDAPPAIHTGAGP